MPSEEISVNDIYNKDDKLRKEDVIKLMEWVEKQPHLPQITELQSLLFLHSCHYSSEMAKNTIDSYFTIKTLCPEIFGNRIPTDPALQNAMNCYLFTFLPELTPEGNRVVFIKFIDTNPNSMNVTNQLICFDMLISAHLHKNGPDNGLILVVDLKGTVFAHLLKVNMMILKKYMYFFEKALPIRAKALHFLNTVPIMDKILGVIRPVLTKELADSIRLHENVESLFKVLPQKIFPQDYGGSCEPTDVLSEKYKSFMNESVDLFKFEATQQVDESRRPGKPKNVNELFGIDGTFRQLNVD